MQLKWTNPSCQVGCSFKRLEEDVVCLLLELLIIFFGDSKRLFDLYVEMMSSFDFSSALFGYLIRLGHKPFSCFSLSSCICSDGAFTSFILDFEVSDRCDL